MTKHIPKAVLSAPQNAPRGYAGTAQNSATAEVEQLSDTLKNINSEVSRVTGEVEQTANTALRKSESTEGRVFDLEQAFADAGSVVRRGGGGAQSWGQQIVSADGFAALRANPDQKHRFQVQQAITTATGSGGALIQPDVRTDPVSLPRRRLRIRDLLNPGSTGSNMVEFAKQVTRTNNAAMTSEGAEKPESVYEWERTETPVRTLPHWVPVSRQAMDDAGVLQSVIDGELRYGLDLIEEQQLLSGDGTGENLSGLITEATAFNPPFSNSGDTDIDVIKQAKAQLGNNEIEATAVILNTLDWERMTGQKDGEDRYLGGGPFGDTAERLWRMAVVPSNSMPEGEFLVGDFRRAATIHDRMDVEILISSEHSDFFIKNMLAVRAEKRLALAITMPAAMVYGELSTASS